MSESIKPLIIIDTAIVGGPGRGLLQLLRTLELKSVNYLICNFLYRRSMSREFETTLREHNHNIHQLKERFRFDPLPLWELIKLIKRNKFSVIQSHGYKSHVMAAVISILFRVPWVAFCHGWTAENRKVKLYHSLD